MKCAYCEYNDGLVYTSIPPKYKCTITNEFHLGFDDCDVEWTRWKMEIPNINEIPKEERDKRNEKCRACGTRKWYAKRLDFHFDWWDCPYDCPNDLEHLMRKVNEVKE